MKSLSFRVKKSLVLGVLALLCVGILVVPPGAAAAGTNIIGLIHEPPETEIGSQDFQSLQTMVSNFQRHGVPTTLTLPKWISSPVIPKLPAGFALDPNPTGVLGTIRTNLQNSTADMNIMWFAGHGDDTTIPGTWAYMPEDRAFWLQSLDRIAAQTGKPLIVVDHSCGSGACVNLAQQMNLQNLAGVIATSDPLGEGIVGIFGGRMSRIMRDFDLYDTNGDNALSGNEFQQAFDDLNELGKYDNFHVWAPDMNAPMIRKDPGLDNPPSTDIKAVCAVLQQDKLEKEIPKFEAKNAPNFPVKGELVKRNELANGSVHYGDPTFAQAKENHLQLLDVLKPLNPSGGSTTQPQRPNSTGWQKGLINYIRRKEVEWFNAVLRWAGQRPGAEPISPSQYHFTNVEGKKRRTARRDRMGSPCRDQCMRTSSRCRHYRPPDNRRI